MLPGWVIVASAFGYLLLLFAVASHGDRQRAALRRAEKRPAGGLCVEPCDLLHLLDLFRRRRACLQRGLEFTGIYIGPILMFTLGMPVLRRIIELAKAEKLTSVADFISARYGKNPAVARSSR
jgi:Na+/proline symporter